MSGLTVLTFSFPGFATHMYCSLVVQKQGRASAAGTTALPLTLLRRWRGTEIIPQMYFSSSAARVIATLSLVAQFATLFRMEMYTYLVVGDGSIPPGSLLSQRDQAIREISNVIQRTDDIQILQDLTPKPTYPEAAIVHEQMSNPEYLDYVNGRRLRFPSVDERVRVYTSTWYSPPCANNTDGFVYYRYPKDSASTLELRYRFQKSPYANQSVMISTDVRSDAMFHVRESALADCVENNPNPAMRVIFCPEVAKFILPFRNEIFEEVGGTVPLIAQVGDASASRGYGVANLPVIKKNRRAVNKATLKAMTSPKCVDGPRMVHPVQKRLSPIVWKLQYKRHFKRFNFLAGEDIPWNAKKGMAVFRGAFTGPNVDDIDDVDQRCRATPRCSLVVNSAGSKIVNAKLTTLDSKVPEVVDGVTVMGERMDRPTLLRYKVLIMLEGNDVSSGLKWAMLSNSIVMLPTPTATSWAMEELLVPFIHYIPLKDDLSDVEEKLQWVLDHDKEAEYISKRSTLWVRDLLRHPDALKENRAVDREVLQRYAAHFKPMSSSK